MGSFDWRIAVNTKDLSTVPTTNLGEVGALVCYSERAHKKPVFFGPGQAQRIVNYFGAPTTSKPDIQEAIDFNETNPIWVASAINTTDTYGAVLLTDQGSTSVSFTGAGISVSSGVSAYTFVASTDFMVVAAKSAYTDDLAVQVSYDATYSTFSMGVYKKATVGYTPVESFSFALGEGAKDGFGNSIYIGNVLDKSDYIDYKVNPMVDSSPSFATTVANDTAPVALAGGAHTVPSTLEEQVTFLNDCWNQFQDKAAYPVDIFMDPTGYSALLSTFDTLSKTYQKYSSYIFMMADGLTAAAAISAKEALKLDNPNIAIYWNRANVYSKYTFGNISRSMIGRIGRKYAAMLNVYDGLAPSYIDEDGHGGQLGRDVSSMKYGPTDAEQKALDAAGMNPLILDNTYGCLIAGQRTAKDPGQKSDYSWIAHTRLFNYIIKNIIQNVLVYQVTKLNDTTHRFQAQTKTEDIIKPIRALNILTDAKILCSEKNNPPSVLAERKFVLSLAVKVTPFSEFIQLNFINVNQLTDVQTVI